MRSRFVNDYSARFSGDFKAVVTLTAGTKSPLPRYNMMYVPIEILGVKAEGMSWLAANRNDIWAEAVHRVKAGEFVGCHFSDKVLLAKEAVNARFE